MPKRPVEKTFVKIRIKKNDQVKVIAGRDKGKTGRVISVDRWRGRLIVEVITTGIRAIGKWIIKGREI